MFNNLSPDRMSPWLLTAAALAAALTIAALALAVVWLRRAVRAARAEWSGGRVLIAVAITAAAGVAVIGGVRSFEAVSQRFGDPLVPLTADGMIVACTALRLAALSRGWRLPGSLITTYLFIAGTVILNASAAHGPADVVAHALAPVAYAVLVELLAHMLRLHLRLARPSKPTVTALTWFTSPVVTTRVWLHLARTGGDDPVAARALVQQVIRMSSRLDAVCPSGRWPLGRARAARVAALQTIRDGLLSAAELAAILPADGQRLGAGALLALVDGAALTRTGPAPGERTGAPAPVRTASTAPQPETSAPEAPTEPHRYPAPPPVAQRPGRDDRTDAELVAELLAHGGPMSQRDVRRLLGVGTPKAKRLAELAGWTTPAGGGPAATDARVAVARPEHHQLQIVALDPEPADNTTSEDDELEARKTR
jgi:hypothetical protein